MVRGARLRTVWARGTEGMPRGMPTRPPDPSPQHPGWYRDPDDPLRHRYWTGRAWRTQEEALGGDREAEE